MKKRHVSLSGVVENWPTYINTDFHLADSTRLPIDRILKLLNVWFKLAGPGGEVQHCTATLVDDTRFITARSGLVGCL